MNPAPAPPTPTEDGRVEDARPRSRWWWSSVGVVSMAAVAVALVWGVTAALPNTTSGRAFEDDLVRCDVADEPGGEVWQASAEYHVSGGTGGSPVQLSLLWTWDPDPSGVDPDAGLATWFSDDASSRWMTWERTENGHVWLTTSFERDELTDRPDGSAHAMLEISGQPIATCVLPTSELLGG